jgi:hypothetical protein
MPGQGEVTAAIEPMLADIVIGDFAHRPGDEDAGIVHQDVEMSEVFGDLAHQARDFIGPGLVGLEGHGAYPLLLQFAHQFPGLVGRTDIADGHVGTVIGQRARDGGADAS